MAMYPNPDRNIEIMKERWGTTRLVTDYYQEETEKTELREIVNDDVYVENKNSNKPRKVFLD